MSGKTTALILFIIFALVGGFYLTLDQVAELKKEVKLLSSGMETTSPESAVIPGKEKSTSTPAEAEPTGEEDIVIPTAILFGVESSPLLSPQTEITVAMEKLVKEKDTGIIKVYLRVYTNKADSYSALEPGNLFEILNPSGQNQKSLETRGEFGSIPPQSSVTGTVTFKVPADQDSIILQIDSKEDRKYYEFDFEKETYKETTLG